MRKKRILPREIVIFLDALALRLFVCVISSSIDEEMTKITEKITDLQINRKEQLDIN